MPLVVMSTEDKARIDLLMSQAAEKIEELRRERRELFVALEPFAEFQVKNEDWKGTVWEDQDDDSPVKWNKKTKTAVTKGDFRQAAEVVRRFRELYSDAV